MFERPRCPECDGALVEFPYSRVEVREAGVWHPDLQPFQQTALCPHCRRRLARTIVPSADPDRLGTEGPYVPQGWRRVSRVRAWQWRRAQAR